MNLNILLLFIFPSIRCATIPSTAQNFPATNSCLVNFLNARNLSISSSDSQYNDGRSDDCRNFNSDVTALLERTYKSVEKNFKNILSNQTETKCLMETFRSHKFLEINIVMTAAYLSSGEKGADNLRDVFERSRNIFTIAMVKCIMTDQTFIEIFDDFSNKLKVDKVEFECIKLIMVGNSDGEEEMTTTEPAWDATYKKNDDVIEVGTTTENVEEISTTNENIEETFITDIPSTVDDDSIKSLVYRNKISKVLSRESSMEPESNEDCSLTITNVRARITNYEYSSLSKDENTCMAKKLSEKDINVIYEIIVTKDSVKTDDIESKHHSLRKLISQTIWNLVECADIYGFVGIVDGLFPKISNGESAN